MPTLSVESPEPRLFPWSFEQGFGVMLGNLASRRLVIRTADTIASQWAGLFYQAHPRIVVQPNSPGDGILFNKQWREAPLALPFHDGQRVAFASTKNIFVGRSLPR